MTNDDRFAELTTKYNERMVFHSTEIDPTIAVMRDLLHHGPLLSLESRCVSLVRFRLAAKGASIVEVGWVAQLTSDRLQFENERVEAAIAAVQDAIASLIALANTA